MTISIEYIKAQLQRRADGRQLPKVAKGAGVGLRTLHRILKTGNCTTTTATKLQHFLEATAWQKRLTDGGQ